MAKRLDYPKDRKKQQAVRGGAENVYSGFASPIEAKKPSRRARPRRAGWNPNKRLVPYDVINEQKARSEYFKDFTISCACCVWFGVPLPSPHVHPWRAPLLEKNSPRYHGLFLQRVRTNKLPAKHMVEEYVARCAAGDAIGKSRPPIPKQLRFALETDGFAAKLDAEISAASG